jgi:hypothetical protein
MRDPVSIHNITLVRDININSSTYAAVAGAAGSIV